MLVDHGQDVAVEIFREHPELETEVQPTVERLLGRPAGALSDWLARHVQRFAEAG